MDMSFKPEDRIWLYVTGAFLLLIVAWTLLIWIANSNQPVDVPLVVPKP